MRAVDGAGYRDQGRSVWQMVTAVTLSARGVAIVGRAVRYQSAGISPGCFSTTQ